MQTVDTTANRDAVPNIANATSAAASASVPTLKPASAPTATATTPVAPALLRFMTCGSVDDGKSTLIGRLLYDAGLIFRDQLADLMVDGQPDCSRLMDGLLAEREQGITIDVAYRHFATATRRFMVADAPGHEEYTPNMVTAASHADAAVVLLDAAGGIKPQTRRHLAVARLLGIGSVLLVVNKMDLVGFKEERFRELREQAAGLARELGLPTPAAVPVCARDGDHVVRPGTRMPWYHGPTVLAWLEGVNPVTGERELPFRLEVQRVCRTPGFRGLQGTVAAGRLTVGERVRVLPGETVATVTAIRDPDGPVESVGPGEAVTVRLTEEVDVGRGALLAADVKPLPATDARLEADAVWMARRPLTAGDAYLFKRGPLEIPVRVADVRDRLNLTAYTREGATTLAFNELGAVTLDFPQPLPYEPFDSNRRLGHGILIDRVSAATVGAVLLRGPAPDERHLTRYRFAVTHADRCALLGQTPRVLWFTGLSGAGKSSVADLVERRLHAAGRACYVLDGDNVRHGLNRDLGFGPGDRAENIRRVAEVARLMFDAGLIVLVTFISPFAAERRLARALFKPGEFLEIFVDTPLQTCIDRDCKGLYRRALAGEIPEMTGVSSPYERPAHPDLVLDGREALPDLAARVMAAMAAGLEAPDSASAAVADGNPCVIAMTVKECCDDGETAVDSRTMTMGVTV